jgi:hypothetical protein
MATQALLCSIAPGPPEGGPALSRPIIGLRASLRNTSLIATAARQHNQSAEGHQKAW